MTRTTGDLGRAPIVTYQLGGALPAALRGPWENIDLPDRLLHFVTLNPITWAVWTCEDIGRREPAAELIRAVGPNLLMRFHGWSAIGVSLAGAAMPRCWRRIRAARVLTLNEFGDGGGGTLAAGGQRQGKGQTGIPRPGASPRCPKR